MIYYPQIKRFFDLNLALVLTLVLLPVFFISIILIFYSSRGPIFFVQNRVGFKGKIFRIFKLRTMHVDNEREIVQTFNRSDGVFFFGALLRRLKIDELPQLINIIKGEMSFIGPRPCLDFTYEEMPLWAKKRVSLLPGITGLAQVNGGVFLTWEERWKYDCKYINELSFVNDLKIVLNTFKVILLGEKL